MSTRMKKEACAITTVRKDNFFLDLWISYYSEFVGRENLYVFLDGDDWDVTVNLSGVNVDFLHDAPRDRAGNDVFRIEHVNSLAQKLQDTYRFVLAGDVDEFVAVDPLFEATLFDVLAQHEDQGYVYALGIDVIQRPDIEGDYIEDRKILGQRRFGMINDRYSKPFFMSKWGKWLSGLHHIRGRRVIVDYRVLNFHFALFDLHRIQERIGEIQDAMVYGNNINYQNRRKNRVAEYTGLQPVDFELARALAAVDFNQPRFDGRGQRGPKQSFHPISRDGGFYIEVPKRFFGIV